MPEKHKETNRFRFKSFNERVQNVRVSAIYRIKTDRAVRQAAAGKILKVIIRIMNILRI